MKIKNTPREPDTFILLVVKGLMVSILVAFFVEGLNLHDLSIM